MTSFKRISLLCFLAATAALTAVSGAGAATLPAGFEDKVAVSGLNQPTTFRFAPDGRVFVGQKGGKILIYDSVSDPTPTLFADLAKPVYDYEDHGLLGLALDPAFNAGRPYVYALYTFNHKLGDKETQTPEITDPKSVTPAWPEYKGPGEWEEDKCPNGEAADELEIVEDPGCEVSGVLVRLTAEGDHAAPSAAAPEEKVLLEGWCQQSTTHSIGDLRFGPEGALFVTGGEGAMYEEPDYGQFDNVCEDPPENGAAEPERLTAEGGSLRSQSVLRNHALPGHATLLSGALLRVDPDTGEGWAGNPYAASIEANARRIFAFGFRNPWRTALNPRTGSLFVANVGNGLFEEIDRVSIAENSALNSGWPCYEGGAGGTINRNLTYVGENPAGWFNVCKAFYEQEENGEQQTTAPFYAYPHSGPVVPGDPCVKPYTDVSGLAFYEGTDYPAQYRNALFFSDAIRGCIYTMQAGPNGEPNPATAAPFLYGTTPFSFPAVEIEQGPNGDLFFTELGNGPTGGTIHRIVYPVIPGPPAPTPIPTPTPEPAPTYESPKIEKRPSKTTTSTKAKFAFKAAPGLRFQCRIDNKKFGGCHSPRTYKNLKPGKHSFRVRPIDSSGAQVAKATLFSWSIVKKG